MLLEQPSQISLARLHTLRAALKLETYGMRKRGPSAYSIIKNELGFTGSKGEVLGKLTKHLFKEDSNVVRPKESTADS